MKKTMQYYVEQTPNAVLAMLDQKEAIVRELCTFLTERDVKRILLIASGSSRHAVLCAEYFMKHYMPCEDHQSVYLSPL